MREIFDHIERHLADSLEVLKTLVREPSVAAQSLGIDRAPKVVAEALRAAGADVEILPVPGGDYPTIYGKVRAAPGAPGAGRTLLFYTHYDVQPADPLELWDSPPFEPSERDGCIYGRGASDDKGNLASRLAVLRAFRDVRGGPPCDILLFVEGEEEVGSPHMEAFMAAYGERFRADACIWEGGGTNSLDQPLIYLGLKGILDVELRATTAATDAHSSYATVVPGAPWRLLRALATLKDDQECITIPGFYDEVRPVTARERAAVEALPDEDEEWLVTFGIEGFLLGVRGRELRLRHIFEPTCNIAGLIGGYTGPGMKTVLPAEASAKLDFRLVPDQRPADIAAKLRRHLVERGFGDIEVLIHSGEHPARTPMDSPWVELVAQAAREVYGREPLFTPNMAMTGPMHPFAVDLHMPVASAGIDHPSNKIHAPNENVRISDFVQGTKHTALVVQRFAEGGTPQR